MQLSQIIRNELLPHVSVGTATVSSLVDLLSSEIEDIVEDARGFTARLISAINIQGDCRGLSWSEDGSLPIMCRFLDSVARLACCEDQQALSTLSIINTIIERWSIRLTELSLESDWSMLGRLPTVSNYYL